jgi:hypothetical protein
MPTRASIRPNAALLFPAPKRLTLAGREFRVRQLRVIDIARLEQMFEDEIGHPLDGLDDALALYHRRDEMTFDEFADLMDTIGAREEAWPPAFDSEDFRRILHSDAGSAVFLAFVLRRSNGPLSDAEVLDVAEAMSADEWEQVHRAAWGFAPWMAYSAPDEPESEPESEPEAMPGRGIDWGKAIDEVSRRGISYEAIGRMTVNQFLNARSEGSPWMVWIIDRPVSRSGSPLSRRR